MAAAANVKEVMKFPAKKNKGTPPLTRCRKTALDEKPLQEEYFSTKTAKSTF